MPTSPVYRYPAPDRACIICEARLPFTRRRDTAYCSNRCRQKAYRDRKRKSPGTGTPG